MLFVKFFFVVVVVVVVVVVKYNHFSTHLDFKD